MNDNLVTDNLGDIRLYNGDCMEWMKSVPDKYYELCIIDPPYGIMASKYERGGTQYGKSKAKCKVYGKKDWDINAPSEDYFFHITRISKNQIIFGANYFISKIPYDSSCWIVWDKQNGNNNYADCELAWTSFNTAVRKFTFKWQGMLQGDMKNKQQRIHPTEKPIKLYEWLLTNYAKHGDKIFDSHFGSLFIGIACHNLGFKLDACELDKEYYQSALKRLKKHQAQQSLFVLNNTNKHNVEQLNLF